MRQVISIVLAIIIIAVIITSFGFVLNYKANPLSLIKNENSDIQYTIKITPDYVINKVRNIIDSLGYIEKIDNMEDDYCLSSYIISPDENIFTYINSLQVIKNMPDVEFVHSVDVRKSHSRIIIEIFLQQQNIYSLSFLKQNAQISATSNNQGVQSGTTYLADYSPEEPAQNQIQDNEYYPAAIIIDDCGDNSFYSQWIALPLDLTFAVFPEGQHAEEFCQSAAASGREIIIHAPMTTDRIIAPGSFVLGTQATEGEISAIIDVFTQNIPLAVGINNHQGSIATSDPVFMNMFFNVLGNYPLFFVDSFTANSSAAYDIALQHGIPSAIRDIFLDNEDDYQYITNQIHEFVSAVHQKGYGIAIGHITRDYTLQAISDSMPYLDQQNIHIIPLSSLIPIYSNQIASNSYN